MSAPRRCREAELGSLIVGDLLGRRRQHGDARPCTPETASRIWRARCVSAGAGRCVPVAIRGRHVRRRVRARPPAPSAGSRRGSARDGAGVATRRSFDFELNKRHSAIVVFPEPLPDTRPITLLFEQRKRTIGEKLRKMSPKTKAKIAAGVATAGLGLKLYKRSLRD